MTDQKKKLLELTYQKWVDICLSDKIPIDDADNIVTDNIMGFGTTLEEKILGVNQVKELLKVGREQGKHLSDKKYIQSLILKRISKNEDTVIFVEEIDFTFKVAGADSHLPLRISSILEYLDESWKVTHWHGSVAVVTDEGDTWHQDELKRKNEELEKLVEERTAELKKSLDDLRQTQEQLIHSEKMASLGELTAGIAHEIQNPLNFVNNFSEINKELIDELKAEKELPDDQRDPKIEEELLYDIYQNLEKIHQHGKRADNIVKGMLLHSRKSNGERQLTDLNALADEYLRLAYHGLRAKDKSFNATLNTDFDQKIGKVNVMPQEIGRVILNLINNAFYAIEDRQKNEISEYSPTIWVGSKKITAPSGEEELEISIRDNGNGIPTEVQQKIFQPFFTTKPSGKGTGLGLSLSYDIIKAHGGKLNLSSEVGIGTEFTINIPIIN